LAAFVFGLSDRNAAVRKMYALSIGHLLKTAKDSSVEKLFAKMKTWYMEKDDDASRMAVALTFQVSISSTFYVQLLRS
jgi:proteasome component ECM29